MPHSVKQKQSHRWKEGKQFKASNFRKHAIWTEARWTWVCGCSERSNSKVKTQALKVKTVTWSHPLALMPGRAVTQQGFALQRWIKVSYLEFHWGLCFPQITLRVCQIHPTAPNKEGGGEEKNGYSGTKQTLGTYHKTVFSVSFLWAEYWFPPNTRATGQSQQW